MNVGVFKKQEDGSFIGSLPTMGLHEISLETVKKQGNGPDYAATVEGAELGAAWKKTAQTGRAYLSLEVNIPGQASVYIAIFATETDGQYVAVWNKAKKAKPEAEQASDF